MWNATPTSPPPSEQLSGSEANTRWSEWFKDVIVSLTDENGDLMTLDEVWHLD